jgi:hypothetical protein
MSVSRLSALPLLACLAITAPATGANAGAWAMDDGATFLALSYGVSTDDDWDTGTLSLYAAHGLTPRLTFGVNLDQRAVGPHTLDLFLRRHMTDPEDRLQVAFEVGIEVELDGQVDGTQRTLSLSSEMGRPTVAVHLGRGFAWAAGTGWIDLRIGVDLPTDGGAPLTEVDAYLGLDVGRRGFASLEVWHDRAPSGTFTAFVPGLGIRLSERATATLRLVHDAGGDVPNSIEIGTWLEF